MAKQSKKENPAHGRALPVMSPSGRPVQKSALGALVSNAWTPLMLAVVAFSVYWPTLKSGFVYDARYELLEEGFISSISNLPAVLSLKVLGMKLVLADRPGTLLYLMLNAALWGRQPFGYHLCGNLLHAANVALLFVLLRRLVAAEVTGLARNEALKAQLAAALATLLFALHPIATETVAAVGYCSDLLAAFFTLAALLAATAFRPERFRSSIIMGTIGTLCAFAAVACKESGLAAAGLLIAYWFLFHRREARGPWLWFLGAAAGVTSAFLAARFLLAPPFTGPVPLAYLGGSFPRVLLIQPRLWVFMMARIVWPAQLSADYTLENIAGLTAPLALALLAIIAFLQTCLAMKSRLGALGVATYWMGLATVSNFIPLYRILADRFYYLPLAGVAMQLLALMLMTPRHGWRFWAVAAASLVAAMQLALLTLIREDVFSSEFTLWSDTVRASPFSTAAHCDLGISFLDSGQVDDAISQFRETLQINPNFADAHNNLGRALVLKGTMREAIDEFQKALAADPNMPKAHDNLGCALLLQGRVGAAIAEIQQALKINPNYIDAHYNLGIAFLQKGETGKAISQFQDVVQLNPDDGEAREKLAQARAIERQAPGSK